jgi:AhpD family alkylhydroperoxidase
MTARMKNPAALMPDVVKPLQTIYGLVFKSGVAPKTLHLVHMRASQINGCAFCVDTGVKHAQESGESVERLLAVSAWREATCFDDAERAALGLSEAMTRLADSSDPVPDPVWAEAAEHFDQPALATLVLWIATSNLFNRVNVTTRQPPGATWN